MQPDYTLGYECNLNLFTGYFTSPDIDEYVQVGTCKVYAAIVMPRPLMRGKWLFVVAL